MWADAVVIGGGVRRWVGERFNRKLRLSRLSAHWFLQAAAAFAMVGAFAVIGQLSLWEYQLSREMDEADMLSRQLLRRAELSADYAVVALEDVFAHDFSACINDDKLQLDALVSSKGAVKDVAIIDNDVSIVCSSVDSSAMETVKSFVGRPSFSSRNTDISLRPGLDEGQGVFALLWRVSPSRQFLIVLNVDTLMFDVFPSKWRDHARAGIWLGTNAIIARFEPSLPLASDVREFWAQSERYPLSVRIEIADEVLTGWDSVAAVPGTIVGGLVGALVAALCVSLINRRYGALLALRKAMRLGEIQPYFQPVFALGSREVVGCEVLVRWIKNGRIKHAPDKFIPRAEEDGSIVELTEYLLVEALVKLKPVLMDKPAFSVAFNVAPHHFQEPGFIDWLSSRIASMKLSPTQIVLEITERQSFSDAAKGKEAVARAQMSGFKVALDDTGIGHNGLANVQELGSDIIKIDKKFVDLVGIDEAATAIVVMLVGLAGRLGLTTVAEGIESEVQLTELLRCGVNEGQGYLVAPPLPIQKFQSFLAQGSA